MSSTLAYTAADSVTMLRRNLKHQLRYPSLTLMLAGMPIVFLLLFVYVFGGQLGTGLSVPGAGHGGRSAYLTYVAPGILVMTVASAALGTAISVASDMTVGIIDRFRTMSIARGAVLIGHVLGSLLQTLVVLAVVTGVALALGFRPSADPLAWLGAAGVLALFSLALIWLSTALGLAAKSVETASNTPMFLTLLPFLSSGFVPTGSMPTGLRQFAEYQPFTAVTQTVRGLLTGSAIAGHAVQAVAWSVGIALACYFWSVRLSKGAERRVLPEPPGATSSRRSDSDQGVGVPYTRTACLAYARRPTLRTVLRSGAGTAPSISCMTCGSPS